MATIKEIIETMPAEAQKEMYQELKAKFEEKPKAAPIDQGLKDFVKAKNETQNQLNKQK